MPVIPVYVARIDFGHCGGMIYSYREISSETINMANVPVTIRAVTSIRIQTPDGFDLEPVTTPSPYGDTGPEWMVFDPVETEKGATGRVYIAAARLIERIRTGPGEFWRVG